MVRLVAGRRALAAIAALTVVAASCGGTDGELGAGGTLPAVPEVPDRPLRILVTNDDGLLSPGLDELVGALAALPDVEVSVVVPAQTQSDASDRTTEGVVATEPGTTSGGVVATVVSGFPADAVVVALDVLALDPDVVVSGVNDGQTVGPLAARSGTVGAARVAARRGVPAVAASAGPVFDQAEVAVAVDLVVEWVRTNRLRLLERNLPVQVVSFNVPSCDAGALGESVEVSLAQVIPDGVDVARSTCPGDRAPRDDVDAMVLGFPARTRVPIELAVPGG